MTDAEKTERKEARGRFPVYDDEPYVTFTVYGVPSPQGSLRAMPLGAKAGGRAIIVQGGTKESRERLLSWRDSCGAAARAALAGQPALAVACAVVVAFYLPRPKSAPKSVIYPAKKPDLDKLVRSLMDALSQVAFIDDALVVDVMACKRFAIDREPGADVELYAL